MFNIVALDSDLVDEADASWVRSNLTFVAADREEHVAFAERDGQLLLPRGAWRSSPMAKRLQIDDRTTCNPAIWPEPRIKLRPYQQLPYSKLVRKGYGLLRAPTGSGKTITMLMVAAALGQRTLVIVHTKDLLHQWDAAAKTVFGDDFRVGIIGDGEHSEANLTIATVQSLSRMGDLPTDWVMQWGMVVLDEAHRCPALSFADVMQQMPAKYLFGATATPKRRDGMEPLMHAIIGPIVASIKESDLVDAGKLMKPTARMVATDFWCPEALRMDKAPSQYLRNMWYGEIVNKLAADVDRAMLIAKNIALYPERSQLILSDRIEHLYLIQRMLDDIDPSVPSFVLTGRHSSREREEVLEGVRTGYFKRLFATQLADEGLDIPRLDTLHLTFPRGTKGAGQKITQQIGRIMRTFKGKGTPLVIDYVDERVTVLRGQATARVQHYKDAKDMEVTGWLPEEDQKAKELGDRIRAKQAARRKLREK